MRKAKKSTRASAAPATTNSPLHDAVKPDPPPPGANPDPPPAPRRSAVTPASSTPTDLGDVELSEREPTPRLSALHERSSEFAHESPLFDHGDAKQKNVQVPGVPEHKPNSEPPPAVTTRQVRDVTLGSGPGD